MLRFIRRFGNSDVRNERDKIKEAIRKSGLFDENFYLVEYPDVRASRYEALDHYLSYGAEEGRNPHPLFNTSFYNRQAGLETGGPLNPLWHYIAVGGVQGFSPSPLFDSAYYLSRHPEVLELRQNPLQHYLQQGQRLGYRCLPEDSLPNFSGDCRKLHIEKNRVLLKNFLNWRETLAFPDQGKPLVSIILVLHNRAELTFSCLLSIARQQNCAFEVVLVDNESTDSTANLLNALENVVVIRNGKNDGFLQAANQGALAASGRYLLFLNNDTELFPDCLTAAVTALESSADIGVVGGKVLNIDGTLQEAGAMIWKGGETTAYGRDKDSQAPEYMFRREVDYCSGCFFMTPAELFRRMGSFDSDYGFGYYEEVDYCLRLKKAGYRTLYEPRACLIHLEHGSSSRDEALLLARKNLAVLKGKHAAVLSGLPPLDLKRQELRRYAFTEKRRILFIDDQIPVPTHGAGYPRAGGIVEVLEKEDIYLTFYPIHSLEMAWAEIYSFLPPEVEYIKDGGAYHLPDFLRNREGVYDDILVSRPQNISRLLSACRGLTGQMPCLIYDAEAFYSSRLLLKNGLHPEKGLLELAQNLRKEEIAFASSSDAILCVSKAEADLFLTETKKPVFKVGTSVEIRESPPAFQGRSGILMVASFHQIESPNYDSLIWVMEKLWPALRKRGIECLNVAGYLAPGCELPPFPEGMRYLGEVADLKPLYDQSRLFLAPTRYAAGIPLKCVEASANGLPMVVSSLLEGQLGWTDGVDLLSASTGDSDDFLEKCLRLYRDETLWKQIQAASLQRVSTEYAQEVFHEQIKQMLEATKPPRLQENTMLNTREDLIRQRDEIASRFGPWTAYALDLGLGVRTKEEGGLDGRVPFYLETLRDFGLPDPGRLSLLDLACLEGGLCLEFGRLGMKTLGIEGRQANLAKAEFVRDTLGLAQCRFEQRDVRGLNRSEHGEFDVVLCCGILYHLTACDAFAVLQRMREVCGKIAFIDTHIAPVLTHSDSPFSLGEISSVTVAGEPYSGRTYLEHMPGSTAEEIEKRLWSSLDNTESFWFLHEDLIRLIKKAGFSAVYNAYPPGYPTQPHRMTFVLLP